MCENDFFYIFYNLFNIIYENYVIITSILGEHKLMLENKQKKTENFCYVIKFNYLCGQIINTHLTNYYVTAENAWL